MNRAPLQGRARAGRVVRALHPGLLTRQAIVAPPATMLALQVLHTIPSTTTHCRTSPCPTTSATFPRMTRITPWAVVTATSTCQTVGQGTSLCRSPLRQGQQQGSLAISSSSGGSSSGRNSIQRLVALSTATDVGSKAADAKRQLWALPCQAEQQQLLQELWACLVLPVPRWLSRLPAALLL